MEPVPLLLRPLACALLLSLVAPAAFGHAGTPPLPGGATLLPDHVVPENGAAAPTGSPATASVIVSLDDVDPRLEYRIFLFDLDLASEVESIRFHTGPPGANGPAALSVWGSTGEQDSDLIVSEPANFMIGIWDDGDGVALSPSIDDLLAGELYLVVTTVAYPLPDTAELRGAVALDEKPGVILGREDGHLATDGEGSPAVANVRVFQALTALQPSVGGRWSPNPRFHSSTSPPGSTALGAGDVHLDAVVEPSTGVNLGYWSGSGSVSFGAVPATEQLEITDGVSSLVLDGGTAPVAGFAIGTTLPDGSGLSTDLDYVLSASVGDPTEGVYLASLRLRHENATTPQSPSPRIFALFGAAADQATLDDATSWIEAQLAVPDCQDGYDNADGDLDPDLSDTGCASALDESEFDLATGCDNGIDDDGDGHVDYPADPECLSAAQVQEVPEPELALGLAAGIALLVGLSRRQVRR